MKPDISVIVTLYNYAHYIGDAIKSFRSQTVHGSGLRAEMIIVDDASTDYPHKAIEQYQDCVRYIRLEKNGGYSHAKNVGIKASLADILVMLDADDMLTKNSLLIRWQKMMQGYDLVHGPATDKPLGNISSQLWNKWLKSPKDASSYKLIHAQTVMLKKDIHRKVGLYDETLRFKSDREMWARVMNHGFKVGYVEEPVAIYRIHDQQMHKSKEKAIINDELQNEVLRKIARRKNDLSEVEMLV